MKTIYITYSNQKAKDVKTKVFDKVTTLDSLILELFEKNNFEIIIDDITANSIIYECLKGVEYFSYLDENSQSLKTIYDFIVLANRNSVEFKTLLNGKKLEAIKTINSNYQKYKQENFLVDIADIEKKVCDCWDSYFLYEDVYVDDFQVYDISYIKSKYQDMILQKLSNSKKIPNTFAKQSAKIIKPTNEVFDSIDEIKTALRISRKLLENGVSSDDILIVASDINEYAPLYKLHLDEYGLKGYSSIGTPLNSFHDISAPEFQTALNSYTTKLNHLKSLYQKLNLKLTKTIKDNLKSTIKVADEKVGIEITEPNQLIGLTKKYKHIIFIGTDINHFPPKANDNFLYTYQDEINYFYANSYFKSSQTQLSELKRVAENLYIITANYKDKRELKPSILLDKKFDDSIDISDIKSINQLSLEKKTILCDEGYFKSITSDDYTLYDGKGVAGFKVTHLSASQINSYNSCPLAYLYKNKLKLKSPKQTEDGFDAMEQGSLMHLCYEFFGRYIQKNCIKSIDKQELYNIMYEVSLEAYNHENTLKDKQENIHHKIFLTTLQAGLKNNSPAGLLAKFVDYYIEQADKFSYFQDTHFERCFYLDDDLKPTTDETNYFIKGFIDRLDNLKDKINIIDYKSKKVERLDKKKQKQIEELEDIQLALYLLYTSQVYPNKSYDAHLLSFKGNSKGVKFATLDDKLYTDEYEKRLKNLIHSTKQNIENGDFSFNNNDEDICGYCDIKFICHENILSKYREF